MITITPKELIDKVPYIQSVSLPPHWFSSVSHNHSIFTSLYEWMVKEGAVPREYFDRLHNLTYVGESTYKKLILAEKKRLKNKHSLRKPEDLDNAVAWSDLGSGPLSQIYDCSIHGNCILVVPESSKPRLYKVAAKIIKRENKKLAIKIKNSAAGATFFQWLVSQTQRPDDIGLLANEVKLDSEFPQEAKRCEEVESYMGIHNPLLDTALQSWLEYTSQYPERIEPYSWCNKCNNEVNIEKAKLTICKGSLEIDFLCEYCIPYVAHQNPLHEISLHQVSQEQLRSFAQSHHLDDYEITPIIERLKVWRFFELNETGFIYFIQSEGSAREIKIGYSKDPLQRLKDLQTGHPSPLKLLATIGGDMKFERALHQKFSPFQVQSEWFSPHPDILEYISTFKSS